MNHDRLAPQHQQCSEKKNNFIDWGYTGYKDGGTWTTFEKKMFKVRVILIIFEQSQNNQGLPRLTLFDVMQNSSIHSYNSTSLCPTPPF